jgi:hypothetical protein
MYLHVPHTQCFHFLRDIYTYMEQRNLVSVMIRFRADNQGVVFRFQARVKGFRFCIPNVYISSETQAASCSMDAGGYVNAVVERRSENK